MAMMWSRINTIILLLVLFALLALIGMVATTVRGGPLDPPGAPGSTMKTLEEIPGSWSRRLPANDGAPGPNPPAGCNSTRFQCVLDDLAVLDRETGLVWQRVPPSGAENWLAAVFDCATFGLGGRAGWRLPTIEEYGSLFSLGNTPPAGHPFANLVSGLAEVYWSSSTYPDGTGSDAFVAYFHPTNYPVWAKTADQHVWCVRGGNSLAAH